MQAIILAAGMGKRLHELTKNNTKCMVKVNGVPLIERTLKILDKKKLSKIVIVVGYKKQGLIEFVQNLDVRTPVVFIENDDFDKTNNIYSLLLAKKYLQKEDTLLLESDIIFEEAAIDLLLDDPRSTLALVDKFASWMDGTCLELDAEDSIVEFIPGKYLRFEEKENYYKTVNIYKFGKAFASDVYVPFLEAYFKAMGVNEYYESVIKLIAMLEHCEMKAKRLTGQKWYEIDDIQDLDIASSIFEESMEKKYELITSRYGGYWRYPTLIDFCYLVNPYFPTEKMMRELKSNFELLLQQYPSGMQVNSLLAAKNFGINQEHIVIGNGAAELIKYFMETLDGTLGIITPTFEEYRHRYKGNIVEFAVDSKDFRYTANDIIKFYDKKEINHLVIINPDNPSGNYIPHVDILMLINWAKAKSINIIIDESFVDFANEINNTLITENILSIYENLYVVKSISKSYGIPGLRLGVLASSNKKMIAKLKKDVAIWNINSFAEFFMQIFEKYKNEYAKSLEQLRISRKELINSLKQLEKIDVFPSEANYVLCEIHENTSQRVATELLQDNILIKDVAPKIKNGKQYIRVAVRTREENRHLIESLRKMF